MKPFIPTLVALLATSTAPLALSTVTYADQSFLERRAGNDDPPTPPTRKESLLPAGGNNSDPPTPPTRGRSSLPADDNNRDPPPQSKSVLMFPNHHRGGPPAPPPNKLKIGPPIPPNKPKIGPPAPPPNKPKIGPPAPPPNRPKILPPTPPQSKNEPPIPPPQSKAVLMPPTHYGGGPQSSYNKPKILPPTPPQSKIGPPIPPPNKPKILLPTPPNKPQKELPIPPNKPKIAPKPYNLEGKGQPRSSDYGSGSNAEESTQEGLDPSARNPRKDKKSPEPGNMVDYYEDLGNGYASIGISRESPGRSRPRPRGGVSANMGTSPNRGASPPDNNEPFYQNVEYQKKKSPRGESTGNNEPVYATINYQKKKNRNKTPPSGEPTDNGDVIYIQVEHLTPNNDPLPSRQSPEEEEDLYAEIDHQARFQ